jgi:hypothetical protein
MELALQPEAAEAPDLLWFSPPGTTLDTYDAMMHYAYDEIAGVGGVLRLRDGWKLEAGARGVIRRRAPLFAAYTEQRRTGNGRAKFDVHDTPTWTSQGNVMEDRIRAFISFMHRCYVSLFYVHMWDSYR